MDRITLTSSDLSSAGYNLENQILEIEFKSGGIYQYYNVPQSIFDGLIKATSHGQYFHQYIKDIYRYSKIG